MKQFFMITKLAVAVSVWSVVSGCEASASQDERHSLTFSGKINEENTDQIIDAIDAKPNSEIVIQVTSTGGDSVAAMRLGEKFRERQVSLIIDRLCHSACAQYLIPSAQNTLVQEGASVAFHNSPADLHIPDHAPDGIKNWHSDFRERERVFFEQRGIDYAAWLWVLRQTQPVCWFEVPNTPPDQINRYGTGKLITSVVPSIEVLEELGAKNVRGYWPSSWDEAIKDGRGAGFSSRLTIKFVERIDRINLLKKPDLPECRTVNRRPSR